MSGSWLPRLPRSNRSLLCCTPPLLLTCLTLFAGGCKGDDNDDGAGGGTTDSIECPDCAPDEDVYACIIDGGQKLLCFDSFAAAQQSCGSKPGNGVLGNGPTTCDNQSADTSADWKPSSFVVFDPDTRTHLIDEGFFEGLRANPDQLLHDQARLEWREGHFEFETIEAGDLAYSLGFQNGDRLLAVNGHPLTTLADAFGAFDAVYDERTFVVEVEREDDLVMLRYELR
ncbi:MAG: PDZ domain-containing protein [Myxococcota bacterium]